MKLALWSLLKSLRVEPIVFLNFATLGIFGLVAQVGMYQVICYNTIGDNPRFDCSKLGSGHGGGQRGGHGHGGMGNMTNSTAHDGHSLSHGDHSGPIGGKGMANYSKGKAGMDLSEFAELETKVQQAAVTWQLILQLAHTLPALFSDTILGALGDRHGRKMNILIGLAGMMISIYPMIIIFTYKNAPLWILVVAYMISGFTGYMSIIMISCFAYLADTVVDPDTLTVRMTYIGVLVSVSGIFSPLIANEMLTALSYAQTTLMCEALLVFAFFLTLMILRQRPPLVMRKIMMDEYIKEHGRPPVASNEKLRKVRRGVQLDEVEKQNGKVPNGTDKTRVEQKRKGGFGEIGSICRSTLQLLKEVYQTYTRPREGHTRLYLLFACIVYFLNVAFEGGVRTNVFGLYVQKSPFNWGASQISTYRSVNSALHLLGSLLGAVLLKKILKVSDTTIILIAMTTHSLECIIFAFARSTTDLYIAAATGLLAHMFQPCIKSFTSKLVEPDEVGKSFTAFGIATNVAFLTSSVLYSSVYAATVGWFAGFAFLLAGGLQLLCMALFLWLHLDYHYDGSIAKCLTDNICVRLIRRGKVRRGKISTVALNQSKPDSPTNDVSISHF